MYRDEKIQLRALSALEDIIDTCATSTACYRCPFCRYANGKIMEERIYQASELCALYDVFGKVPRAIDETRLTSLFEEGRIGNEILHEENSGELGECGCSDSQTFTSADRSS